MRGILRLLCAACVGGNRSQEGSIAVCAACHVIRTHAVIGLEAVGIIGVCLQRLCLIGLQKGFAFVEGSLCHGSIDCRLPRNLVTFQLHMQHLCAVRRKDRGRIAANLRCLLLTARRLFGGAVRMDINDIFHAIPRNGCAKAFRNGAQRHQCAVIDNLRRDRHGINQFAVFIQTCFANLQHNDILIVHCHNRLVCFIPDYLCIQCLEDFPHGYQCAVILNDGRLVEA